MTFTVQNNKLCHDGVEIYEAPGEIDDTLVSQFNPQAVMIIYDAYDFVPNKEIPAVYRKAEPELQKLINQNVLCIDKTGHILWRIEPSGNRPVDHVRFIKNRPDLEGLWVYRRDAEEFKIDPQNGKILDWQMGL